MNSYFENFISHLNTNGDSGELYKWEAIDHFQKIWNIEAVDFPKMFEDAFRYIDNLLYHNSRTYIGNLVASFPERGRQMFKDLYNEEISLNERIKNFQETATALVPEVKKAINTDKLKDSQDERTLSVYLSFRYPEKYFLYKASYYIKLCEQLNEPVKNPGYRFFHFMELAQQIKESFIANNLKYIALAKKIYPSVSWDDTNLHTQNFIYYSFEISGKEGHKEEMTGEKELIIILNNQRKSDILNYFSFLDTIVSSLNLQQEDQRIATNTPSKQLSFIVGQRYCWVYFAYNREKGKYMLITSRKVNHVSKPFDGTGKVPYYNDIDDFEFALKNQDSALEAMQNELNRSKKSSFLNSLNFAFRSAIFDKKYREKLFTQIKFKNSDVLTDLMKSAIESSEIQRLINEQEFHFQYLFNVQQQFFEYDISEQELRQLLKDYESYKEGTFEDFVLHYNQSSRAFLDLLAEYISYLDQNASGKNRWNKYDDKRTIALAFVRMPHWVRNLLNLKINSNFVATDSIKNAVAYSKEPENNLTVLSENHRKKISFKVLGVEYDESSFQNDLSEFLRPFNIEPSNNKNYTYILSSILYTPKLKAYWNSENGGELIEIELKKDLEIKDNMKSSKRPLNQILYGPPGTGKTYKLQKEYFPLFTVAETSLSRKQYLENLLADKTWWQVISLAVLDLKLAKVEDILQHELVQIKVALSNSNNPRPTIWGRLQAHTVEECPNVNVRDRSEPRLFFKNEQSQWSIIEENLTEFYPEAYDLLEKSKSFEPKPNKQIKNYEFITFHQSFSYEDFIEGIKPKLDSEEAELSYEITDGIFKKMALRASADPENKYAIFIDEINRGNVSAIFGELITLIEDDKRSNGENPLNVKLPYSKKTFEVPSNLYIFGTMNTADRSVEALDTALRRRFNFVEIMPRPELLENIEFDGFNLKEVLTIINDRIEFLLDRDHTIGHSYFMKLASGDTQGLKMVFENKVIPLLQEYFYHDYEKIALILGSGFVHVIPNHRVSFPKFDHIPEPDGNTLFQLIKPIDDIEVAVQKLIGNENA